MDWANRDRHRGFLHLTRQLISLRLNRTGSTRGLRGRNTRLIRVDHDRHVLVFHRWFHGGPGDDVVVAVNLGTHPITGYEIGFPRWGRWRVRCNTDAPEFGDWFGALHVADLDTHQGWRDGQPQQAAISIGPYSAVVFSQDD